MQLSYIVSHQPYKKGVFQPNLHMRRLGLSTLTKLPKDSWLISREPWFRPMLLPVMPHCLPRGWRNSTRAPAAPSRQTLLWGSRGREARICCCSLLVIYWPSDFSQADSFSASCELVQGSLQALQTARLLGQQEPADWIWRALTPVRARWGLRVHAQQLPLQSLF